MPSDSHALRRALLDAPSEPDGRRPDVIDDLAFAIQERTEKAATIARDLLHAAKKGRPEAVAARAEELGDFL